MFLPVYNHTDITHPQLTANAELFKMYPISFVPPSGAPGMRRVPLKYEQLLSCQSRPSGHIHSFATDEQTDDALDIEDEYQSSNTWNEEQRNFVLD